MFHWHRGFSPDAAGPPLLSSHVQFIPQLVGLSLLPYEVTPRLGRQRTAQALPFDYENLRCHHSGQHYYRRFLIAGGWWASLLMSALLM